MREIEFRGKLKRTGKWAYGNLNINKAGTTIITPDETPLGTYGEVDLETVGEYTNRQDSKGNKIYTGDIVKSGEEIGIVVFDKEYLGYFVNFAEQEPLYDVYIEKIGNIYDNLELLDKED